MSVVVSSFSAVSGSLRSVPSAPVSVLSVSFVGSGPSCTVVARCSDGRSRRMRVANVGSVSEARAVTRAVLAARDSGSLVRFVAAGRNSPDIWFCGLV